jgi:hypothetical protein
MNARHLPLVFGSMILLGLVAVLVPLLVETQTVGPTPALAAVATGTAPQAQTAAQIGAADPYQGRHFQRLERTAAGVLYGIARDEGLLVSYDGGRTWVSRSDGLPQKIVYPFDRSRPRELTALALDPHRPGRVAVTTNRTLHVSDDSGQNWRQISVDRPDPDSDTWPLASDHFTAVAFDPDNTEGYLLGTSFGGFYATSDGGRTWSDPSRNASFLRRGAGMYEEVAGIGWVSPRIAAPDDAGLPDGPAAVARPGPRSIVVAEGFGGGIYLWDPETRAERDLAFPGGGRGERTHGLRVESRIGEDRLIVTTDTSIWALRLDRTQWTTLGRAPLAGQPPSEPDTARKARLQSAANRTGIYVSSLHAASGYIDRHLDFVVRNGLNSIVVDCKEDFGYVTYDTRLELPRAMGAVRVRFRLEDLLAKAHARGIYVIARVLVFKDRLMYTYDNHAHAVWDRVRNTAWADLRSYEDEETGETGYYQREHWTDPFDPFVTDYNISIARELESRGVDEIQFDYIRFPTDGNLKTATYRHRKAGMNNADALESFLVRAREALRIPISTDLYGFNSWHRMGTTNGQDIVMFSRYVDVISPMFYPNHFPLPFLRDIPYLERAARIYLEGTRRATSLVGENSLIRPYVQAFLLRNVAPEAELGTAEAGSLLLAQVRAALAAPSSGYTLWNASNEYYMVTTSLAPYQPGR